MTDVILPPDIVPSDESVEMVDDGTVVFTAAFGSSITQRAQYAEPHLSVTQTFTSLRLEDKARMIQTIDLLEGKYNTLRARVGFINRGVFPSTELLTNNSFVNSISGWTAAGQLALTASDRIMRMTFNGNSGTNYYASQVVTLTQSAAYAAQAAMIAGYNTTGNNCGPMVGSGSGLSNYIDGRTNGAGVKIGSFITPVNSATFNVQFNGASNSAGDYMSTPFTSIARCALVDSGSQTGNYVRVKSLPNSTENLYYTGDLVSINGEIKRLTAPLNSDGSGKGYIQFSPALYRTVTGDEPIVHLKPFGKFILEDSPKWTNKYGQYADVTLKFRHIYE